MCSLREPAKSDNLVMLFVLQAPDIELASPCSGQDLSAWAGRPCPSWDHSGAGVVEPGMAFDLARSLAPFKCASQSCTAPSSSWS